MTLKKRLLYPFARRFFAGTKLADAVARARTVNALGMGATLDYLGEDVTDGEEAMRARAEYERVIDALSGERLDASLAIKLTHIGLDIGREAALLNALEIIRHAKARGVRLWVDMEGSRHTQATIDIYREMLEIDGTAGIALQAYLKRTWDDLKALVAGGATVRLVKGAYSEPPEIAIQDMGKLRARYIEMTEYLFDNARYFAVGTHDTRLINRMLKMSSPTHSFEFQMLMGIRDRLKMLLRARGHRVVEYVPYGEDWYGYGIRRIGEKRRNILYFAQGLIGR